MLRVALCVPVRLGLKRTRKEVILLEITVVGVTMRLTRKSAAAAPFRLRLLTIKFAVPLLLMVKVRVMAAPRLVLPKSVWSLVEGLVSSSAMGLLLPNTLISGIVVATSTPTEALLLLRLISSVLLMVAV